MEKKLLDIKGLFFLLLLFNGILQAQTSLEINVIGEAVVGEQVTVEVTANHSGGINKIWLTQDSNTADRIELHCNGSTTCSITQNVIVENEGSMIFDAVLWGMPYTFITETTVAVDFICAVEYCELDPEINAFFKWMRSVGYDECIIERYYTYVSNPFLKMQLKNIARQKENINYEHGDTIIFYDIIPTDNQATYTGMDVGEAYNCVPSPLWPQFCPTPTSADYLFLEDLWRTVFNIDFNFEYQRMELNYANTFGPPTWNAQLQQWQFLIPNTFFINTLESKNIAHFAIDSWNNQPIREINGGRSSAQLFSEPTTAHKFTIYTHEWGHSNALSHSFVDIEGTRTFLTPDGVMSNTYQANTSLFDPLDPLERYVFEPTSGFIDQSTFAAEYSAGIVSSYQFNNICEDIDPAITNFELVSTSATEYVFAATLNNFGNMDAPFIDVAIFQGSLDTPALAIRTFEVLEPNSAFDIQITLNNQDIDENQIFIKVDPNNFVVDENESNNMLSQTITLGTEEHLMTSPDLKIFPNPVTDILEIQIGDSLRFRTKVFDLTGKLLMEDKNRPRLNLSQFSNGIYILEIFNESLNQKTYKKIVIEH